MAWRILSGSLQQQDAIVKQLPCILTRVQCYAKKKPKVLEPFTHPALMKLWLKPSTPPPPETTPKVVGVTDPTSFNRKSRKRGFQYDRFINYERRQRINERKAAIQRRDEKRRKRWREASQRLKDWHKLLADLRAKEDGTASATATATATVSSQS